MLHESTLPASHAFAYAARADEIGGIAGIIVVEQLTEIEAGAVIAALARVPKIARRPGEILRAARAILQQGPQQVAAHHGALGTGLCGEAPGKRMVERDLAPLIGLDRHRHARIRVAIVVTGCRQAFGGFCLSMNGRAGHQP